MPTEPNDLFTQSPNTNIDPVEAFCVAVQETMWLPVLILSVVLVAYKAWQGFLWLKRRREGQRTAPPQRGKVLTGRFGTHRRL